MGLFNMTGGEFMVTVITTIILMGICMFLIIQYDKFKLRRLNKKYKEEDDKSKGEYGEEIQREFSRRPEPIRELEREREEIISAIREPGIDRRTEELSGASTDSERVAESRREQLSDTIQDTRDDNTSDKPSGNSKQDWADFS